MYDVAEVEIASALEYAHARAAALIAEAEAEAESIRTAAKLGLTTEAPAAWSAVPTPTTPSLRSTPWSIPVEAILPMLALLLVLVVVLAWMG